MRSYLDFEKPVAELEAKVEELRAMRPATTLPTSPTRSAGSRPRRRRRCKRTLCRAHAVAEDPGRAPSAAAALPRLHRRADHRVHRRSPATANSARTRRSSAASAASAAKASASSDTRRAPTTESRLKHNFGMARPEGYRKAVRLMEMADRFDIPVIMPGRHRRRLSGHRRRGARPSRSDRALDRGLPQARRAERRGRSSAKAARAAPSRSPPPTAC